MTNKQELDELHATLDESMILLGKGTDDLKECLFKASKAKGSRPKIKQSKDLRKQLKRDYKYKRDPKSLIRF